MAEATFFMQEWTPIIGENYNAKEKEANEQNPYAVAVVKKQLRVVGYGPIGSM